MYLTFQPFFFFLQFFPTLKPKEEKEKGFASMMLRLSHTAYFKNAIGIIQALTCPYEFSIKSTELRREAETKETN